MSLSLEEHIQKSREAVAANRAKGNKHAELFARLYHDPYRFLEEILQNTEDAYARKGSPQAGNSIRFEFSNTGLDILHNGIDFSEDDLKAITTFAGTTKTALSEINQIGKFGIGFRSVYSLTSRPELHSGRWHFAIEDYEVLEATARVTPALGYGTLIRLPFRESEIKKITKDVREGLDRLDATALLFLKQIDTIEIVVQGKLHRRLRLQQETLVENIIRKTIIVEGKNKAISDFLLLCNTSNRLQDECSIAFKLCVDDKGQPQIVKEENSPLFVYFKTLQESHLNFLLHARFSTTPTREAVPFDASQLHGNLHILDRAAALLARSMVSLRNLGYITASFFDVLPLTPAAEQHIVANVFHRELCGVLKQKKIIPDFKGHYRLAEELAIADDQALMEIFDSNALVLLYQRSYWVHPDIAQKTVLARALTSACGIKEIDYQSAAFRIAARPDFLMKQPNAWFPAFYSFLASHTSLWDQMHRHEHYSLRYLPIIRLKSGETVAAYNRSEQLLVHFPSGKRIKEQDIHPLILRSEAALSFLQMLGIREFSKPQPEENAFTLFDVNESNLLVLTSVALDAAVNDHISTSKLLKGLDLFLQQTDSNQRLLSWSIEYARRLISSMFPGIEVSGPKHGHAILNMKDANQEQSLFVAYRGAGQHRYHLCAEDWVTLATSDIAEPLLLLVSDAGTMLPKVQLVEHPVAEIKKGRFVSDPIGFNFLD